MTQLRNDPPRILESKKSTVVLDTGREGYRSEILFSYGRTVACIDRHYAYRTVEKHSSTTSKHINAFLKTTNHKQRTVGQAFFDETGILSETADERSVRADEYEV